MCEGLVRAAYPWSSTRIPFTVIYILKQKGNCLVVLVSNIIVATSTAN